MKFTTSWLRDFLNFDKSLDTILETLTNSGLEVEEVIDLGAELLDFSVAQIIDFEKHPDADKLNVCRVATKDGELQIVCGAPNVKKDMKVILAPLGSIVPANAMKIKKVKIRGVESCGMMCSLTELNLGNDSEGIIEVDPQYSIGTKAAKVFNLDDSLIELAITPNRGDAVSVYGIARELAANNIGRLIPLSFPDQKAKFSSDLLIANKNPELFRQFNIMEIRNVKNIESPDWLKQRLESVGIAPKSALVDITNYMCIAYGQPMHCYDKARISGNITLTSLEEAEEFDGLDAKQYNLEVDDIVIRDTHKIIALAGILGSESCGSSTTTTDIFLEAAEFDHIAVTKTGRRHQINSESRFRFERRIDTGNVANFLNIAAKLIADICGGEASNIISITPNGSLVPNIKLSYKKISGYLGIDISISDIDKIISQLNFTIVNKTSSEIIVSPPSYRNDISLDIDVIEEVARIYGIDKIPEQKFDHKLIHPELISSPSYYNVKKKLTACGLNEIINFPFTSHIDNANFDQAHQAILIINPINTIENQLRVSLIGSLLKQVSNSQKRDLNMQSFFEIGNICHNDEDSIKEEQRLGLVRVGARAHKQVNNGSADFDIFDIKSDLEQVCSTLNIPINKLVYTASDSISLHPSKAFNINYAGKHIGIIGELHPLLNKSYDVIGKVQILELILDNIRIATKKSPPFKINDLQKLKRDLAFVISEEIAAGVIQKEIYKQAPEIIQHIAISDVYKDKNIGDGFKSVAFNMIIQPQSDNLNAQAIDKIMGKIITHIESKFNCRLRA
ncbi:MAG: phenylalanine--tRNA ligase subunit beta [Rickettsiales bacterium]|jgi:phenylalanyl-tRNA synthetase beta chain|nr:phenylalanine--tRNA ligase subunit beta [Rickettsiales bacterium]